MKAALGMVSSYTGNGFAGLVMFFLVGGCLFWLVFWRRATKDKPAFAPIELVVPGIALALAAVQIGLQGQATLDDLWFTPLYMALPIWVGVRRGSEVGLIVGFFAGVALVVASSIAGVPSWASVGGDTVPVGEHFAAALFLAATGGLAGRIRSSASELQTALPLAWLLYFAMIDRSQLASLTGYAHLLVAVSVTALGLLAERLGLTERISKRVSAIASRNEA